MSRALDGNLPALGDPGIGFDEALVEIAELTDEGGGRAAGDLIVRESIGPPRMAGPPGNEPSP